MRDKRSFIAAKRLEGDRALLISRICDMISISGRSFSQRYLGFLSEEEAALAEEYLFFSRDSLYELYGGYDNAARRMLCVYPEEYMRPERSDYPIKTVRFESSAAASISHRDYLGSLMALGIERSCTGDIVLFEGGAYALLRPAAAELAVGLEKIGRVCVKAAYAGKEDIIVREDRFTEISGTAASLRLDCITALALRVSREKAAGLIRSGYVSVDHTVCTNVSEIAAQGSVLSVRGFGRFVIFRIGDRTKKDRLHIVIKKYI